LRGGYKLDFLVRSEPAVELTAVDTPLPVHNAHAIRYLDWRMG
jgi:hypothetical protein